MVAGEGGKGGATGRVQNGVAITILGRRRRRKTQDGRRTVVHLCLVAGSISYPTHRSQKAKSRGPCCLGVIRGDQSPRITKLGLQFQCF